jgi:hypothetical protein
MRNLKLVEKPSLYETDFYAWSYAQADLLKAGKFAALDIENIVEELESLGKSDRRALISAYTLLIMHLLKWQYQPQFQGKSWRLTIQEQRRTIEMLEDDNRSLKAKAALHIIDSYKQGKKAASIETELPLSSFPEICPYTLDQLRDFDWMPAS